MKSKTGLTCCIMFLWIWLVSMVDHYFTIKLAATIETAERNPIGLWLLKIDGGSPALFMTIKMMCLWVIAIIIFRLYLWKPYSAVLSLLSLSLIQLFLVFFFLYTPA
jgi:hypothetical protein